MRIRRIQDLPPQPKRAFERAKQLEWLTIGYQVSAGLALVLVGGGLESTVAILLEDFFAIVPAVTWLISARIASRPPDREFPYGYQRVYALSFLASAAALIGLGAFILVTSVLAFVEGRQPTIGQVTILGQSLSLAWLTIPALLYSGIPAVWLGRQKIEVARSLHDGVLHADADMNKADWLTAGAGIVAVVGVLLGFWWVDPLAALVIALDILYDGLRNLLNVLKDLMDETPRNVEHTEVEPAVRRLVEALERLDWVEEAAVRLRDEGHVFVGEAYVVPRRDIHLSAHDLVVKIEEARQCAYSLDWKLNDLAIMPVESIGRESRSEERRRR